MQKYFFLSLSVLATFVLTDAKPWCDQYRCTNDEYGGDIQHGEDALHGDLQYGQDPINGDVEYGQDAYLHGGVQIQPQRASNGFSSYPGQDHFGYGSQSKVDPNEYFGGINIIGGRQNGYDDVQNGYGKEQNGFNDGQNGFDDGQNGFDDGQNGYDDERTGRGSRPTNRNKNYGVKIYSFGNGVRNKNTFNLGRESFGR